MNRRGFVKRAVAAAVAPVVPVSVAPTPAPHFEYFQNAPVPSWPAIILKARKLGFSTMMFEWAHEERRANLDKA